MNMKLLLNFVPYLTKFWREGTMIVLALVAFGYWYLAGSLSESLEDCRQAKLNVSEANEQLVERIENVNDVIALNQQIADNYEDEVSELSERLSGLQQETDREVRVITRTVVSDECTAAMDELLRFGIDEFSLDR